MTITLGEVRELADQLTPIDQVRLIAYLSQRLADEAGDDLAAPPVDSDNAWDRLLHTLDAIGTGPWATEETATAVLAAMRR